MDDIIIANRLWKALLFTNNSGMGKTSTSSTLPSMGNVSTSLSSLLMGNASTSSYGGRYGKGINLLTVYLWEKGQHPQILPVTCTRLGDNGSMNQHMRKASSHGRNWCGEGINNTPSADIRLFKKLSLKSVAGHRWESHQHSQVFQ